ncbi:hypothetical protein BCR32DRAFT_285229 [Anaeromyces robustus]|uniref:Uncharacterized protein n=1 Tax=Anaeromyces robustus TaxID=1754192 RepID=A0A1Y1WQJ7_9FUNG|nr:hypothetical protein BCR32DRAFT_285229 [Anaeromyces robustus]|eukprot:ORX75394.1 hypothetical protein BCR32DRAFT_285229 [Anaeromyces robustus]
MKFSIFNLLILLSVSSALSLNLNNIVSDNSNNQGIENNQNITNSQGIENNQNITNSKGIEDPTLLQCGTSIKNLNCELKQDDLTNFNYDKICKVLSDKKCDAYYYGISELEGCKDIPPEKLKKINVTLKAGYAVFKMLCEYDEEGKECPFTTYMKETMEKYMIIEILPTKEIVVKTCKSKKCSESLAQYITDIEEGLGIITPADEFLLSEECVKVHASTSGTSLTIKKLGTTMLITVSLLLLYLLN